MWRVTCPTRRRIVIAASMLFLGGKEATAEGQVPAWSIETLDKNNLPWQDERVSLEFGLDGKPSVVYSSSTQVIFAHWNGYSWDREVLGTGCSPDLACDPLTGEAVATFLAGHVLKLGRRSGSGWKTEDVDTHVDSASLACDPNDGRAAVASRTRKMIGGRWQSRLKLARQHGASWNVTTIESGPLYGRPSLDFDNAGNPSVAYARCNAIHPHPAVELKIACWNADSQSWDLQVVAAHRGHCRTGISLAHRPGSGYPEIAYSAGDDEPTIGKLARWTGKRWEVEVFSDDQRNGRGCSLAYDALGTPYVSHYGRRDLYITSWSGKERVTEIVDSSPGVTYGPMSVALGPKGRPPAVCYVHRVDSTWNTVKFARRERPGPIADSPVRSNGLIPGKDRMPGHWLRRLLSGR